MAAIVIELYGLKIKDLENKMMDPGRHGYHVMAKNKFYVLAPKQSFPKERLMKPQARQRDCGKVVFNQ